MVLSCGGAILACTGRIPDEQKAIDAWIKKNRETIDRADTFLVELWSVDVDNLSMIAVASRKFWALTNS